MGNHFENDHKMNESEKQQATTTLSPFIYAYLNLRGKFVK